MKKIASSPKLQEPYSNKDQKLSYSLRMRLRHAGSKQSILLSYSISKSKNSMKMALRRAKSQRNKKSLLELGSVISKTVENVSQFHQLIIFNSVSTDNSYL